MEIKNTTETNTHLFFWGSIFSNFYLAPFTYKGISFKSSEQAFMYAKAKHFKDELNAAKILTVSSPKEAKALGRTVTPFNAREWSDVSYAYMVEILLEKFSQNPSLKRTLVSKKDKIFVEASPFDKIYGIGLHWKDPLCLDEKNWKGQNLLGKALNEVCNKLL